MLYKSIKFIFITNLKFDAFDLQTNKIWNKNDTAYLCQPYSSDSCHVYVTLHYQVIYLESDKLPALNQTLIFNGNIFTLSTSLVIKHHSVCQQIL